MNNISDALAFHRVLGEAKNPGDHLSNSFCESEDLDLAKQSLDNGNVVTLTNPSAGATAKLKSHVLGAPSDGHYDDSIAAYALRKGKQGQFHECCWYKPQLSSSTKQASSAGLDHIVKSHYDWARQPALVLAAAGDTPDPNNIFNAASALVSQAKWTHVLTSERTGAPLAAEMDIVFMAQACSVEVANSPTVNDWYFLTATCALNPASVYKDATGEIQGFYVANYTFECWPMNFEMKGKAGLPPENLMPFVAWAPHTDPESVNFSSSVSYSISGNVGFFDTQGTGGISGGASWSSSKSMNVKDVYFEFDAEQVDPVNSSVDYAAQRGRWSYNICNSIGSLSGVPASLRSVSTYVGVKSNSLTPPVPNGLSSYAPFNVALWNVDRNDVKPRLNSKGNLQIQARLSVEYVESQKQGGSASNNKITKASELFTWTDPSHPTINHVIEIPQPPLPPKE